MKTRNFWPYGIITAFVIFISGTIGLILLACSHKMDLVNANYYEQEIRFQNHIDTVRRTQALGTAAVIAFDPATQKIAISIPHSTADSGIVGSVHLYRPSAASLDRELSLATSPDTQFIDTSALKPGLWSVRVSWRANDRDFFIERKIIVERRLA